ncbi:HAD family hydrolase [Thalassobaculum litoreum]|uniref:phosphoglycolate phosphatase n=1 Tax=Thalassobaculum litoreum DSM 18839 TaxID=1123362 RepID=A0A8G2BJI8_9PROT|nr:HAD family hydrolase [Thalassobaculum litoreum]SDG05445.1 phosphoglycolate phosphatase [Thalassobaculum litoreum DSM 18839]
MLHEALAVAGIRGIVFDKDGTLIRFEETWTPAFWASAEALADDLGRPGLAEALMVAGGWCPDARRILPGTELASGTTDVVARLWRAVAPELPEDAELIPWLDSVWHAQAMAHLTPIDPLPSLFAGLRADGLRCGLATNDSETGARDTAERLGIAPHLSFTVGYDSGHGAKPGPGMLLAAQAAWGLAPAKTAMVGDSPADLAAGRAAGCGLVIGVLSGASGREVLEPLADLLLEDVHRLRL